MFRFPLLILAALTFSQSSPIFADEEMPVIELTTNDGIFSPSEVVAPADKKFKLIVKNIGKTAEEFESLELNREKIIQPGKQVTILLGPLPKGTYAFFGEFHADTAKGNIVLK